MQPQKSASHKLLKSINQQKVLHLIFANGPISRVELTHMTGLSQQTVTNIVSRLIQDDLVVEGETLPLENGSGRKRVSLAVNSSKFYAIGIELAGKYIRGSVCNFRYEHLGTAERRTKKYETPDHLLQLLVEVIGELLQQVPDVGKTKGIGISVQGLVDSRQGVLLRTPGLGFQRIPLKQQLEQQFELPVYIENDANLLAVNQNMSGSLSKSSSNITLKFDYGIGGAIVADNQLISGSNFVAGEFGHIKGFTGPDAYPCHCGGTGCLTTLASTSGLAKAAGCTLDAFAEGVRSGDEDMNRLYDKIVGAVSIAISNVVTFLNPDHVLLTGSVIAAFEERIVADLTKKIYDNIPQTSRGLHILHLSQMPDETELAAGLVLKRVFEIPLDTLSL
ncbi:ROK family transcriptional regulator [Paenibacillus mesophilus]|uniref:ROK family transcriptional regulator n=1 Tax=Paenibacillus mesophilus TaxID=2582849 RepID=UPI00110D6645|nr:ROK family transcriptional regulator [Paenibacillus mesophilus]TMV43891.1 ROK family transcriptional regulator [Paenibacillus mesophilus]